MKSWKFILQINSFLFIMPLHPFSRAYLRKLRLPICISQPLSHFRSRARVYRAQVEQNQIASDLVSFQNENFKLCTGDKLGTKFVTLFGKKLERRRKYSAFFRISCIESGLPVLTLFMHLKNCSNFQSCSQLVIFLYIFAISFSLLSSFFWQRWQFPSCQGTNRIPNASRFRFSWILIFMFSIFFAIATTTIVIYLFLLSLEPENKQFKYHYRCRKGRQFESKSEINEEWCSWSPKINLRQKWRITSQFEFCEKAERRKAKSAKRSFASKYHLFFLTRSFASRF